MKRIAILGKGASRHQKPHRDSGWEFWGLGHDDLADQFDRVFEVHRPGEYASWSGYVEKLKRLGERVTLRLPNPDLPQARTYPIKDIQDVDKDNLTSSIAYLAALAVVTEEPEELGFWGCDFDLEHEYRHQLPSVKFWCGFAKAREIRIEGPKQCRLFKSDGFYGD